MKEQYTSMRWYAAVGAVIGWLALALQFYVMLNNRVLPVPESILRFFSYFTILTNIIAALSYTAVWINSSSGILKKLTNNGSLTAVTVYILVVGIIYNTVLRSLSDPQGLYYIADRLLHTVIPISFIIFWFLFVNKNELSWKSPFTWLWYPVAYIIYVIVLGSLTGFYPYPFADVSQLGYSKALMNGVLITAGFYALGLLFTGIAKRMSTR